MNPGGGQETGEELQEDLFDSETDILDGINDELAAIIENEGNRRMRGESSREMENEDDQGLEIIEYGLANLYLDENRPPNSVMPERRPVIATGDGQGMYAVPSSLEVGEAFYDLLVPGNDITLYGGWDGYLGLLNELVEGVGAPDHAVLTRDPVTAKWDVGDDELYIHPAVGILATELAGGTMETLGEFPEADVLQSHMDDVFKDKPYKIHEDFEALELAELDTGSMQVKEKEVKGRYLPTEFSRYVSPDEKDMLKGFDVMENPDVPTKTVMMIGDEVGVPVKLQNSTFLRNHFHRNKGLGERGDYGRNENYPLNPMDFSAQLSVMTDDEMDVFAKLDSRGKINGGTDIYDIDEAALRYNGKAIELEPSYVPVFSLNDNVTLNVSMDTISDKGIF